ncbi:hypothetical protein CBR_g28786 [Chara braunii]|uniref:Uncharacterized protein n=1 Tax=Chara braunii TaxID=69332 RepID=A0A388L9T8_CHABU|nr:hypothetical protein CBR_g28786 [Chara braunii]|eukprot:GBG79071.1 hypothetical protein CBR_g28786 [Chara braunii]
MPRWEGKEAYLAEQRRLHELETGESGGARPTGGSQLGSGGPTVGVQTESDCGIEGESAPVTGGDTAGRFHGDDGDEPAEVHSSDDGDGGKAPDEDSIDRVIVDLCTTDVGGGLQGAHDTSQSADVVVEEEAGLRTDRAVGDSVPRHSPVIEGDVHVGNEDRSSPPRDVEGDISLTLIVRPPSASYADEGITGCRMDDRPRGSTIVALDLEELERAGLEDSNNHTGRRSDPRRPADGFALPLGGYLRALDGQGRHATSHGPCDEGLRQRRGVVCTRPVSGGSCGGGGSCRLGTTKTAHESMYPQIVRGTDEEAGGFPGPGAVDDIRRGLPYTSGEEGDLYMPAGARRHGSLSALDAQIAAKH